MAEPRRSSGPLYQQIADDLRAQIKAPPAENTLEVDEKGRRRLPTEGELCRQYGVNRGTVRQALADLVNEGLIVSSRPLGYFVRELRFMSYRPLANLALRPPDAKHDHFVSTIAAAGREPAQTIEVAIVVPPPEIAERLQLGSGESAVVRRRVRSIDGEPFNINDSYFPAALVEGSEIMHPADIARGANRVLAELGYEQVRTDNDIYIRMPRPAEVHRLQLVPGTPVGVHYETGYTCGDLPVRAVENVLPGDRHVIKFENKLGNPPVGEITAP